MAIPQSDQFGVLRAPDAYLLYMLQKFSLQPDCKSVHAYPFVVGKYVAWSPRHISRALTVTQIVLASLKPKMELKEQRHSQGRCLSKVVHTKAKEFAEKTAMDRSIQCKIASKAIFYMFEYIYVIIVVSFLLSRACHLK